MLWKKSKDESNILEYEDKEDEDNLMGDLAEMKKSMHDLVEINRGMPKMKGNVQDIIELCEKRERKIKKLKLEITKLKS